MEEMQHILQKTTITEWKTRVTAAMNERSYQHCSEERFHDLLMKIPALDIPSYMLHKNLIRQAGVDISACQGCVSRHTVSHSRTFKHSLWRVAPSMGKSHIIAFVTLLLMSTPPYPRVSVLYANELLLEKDQVFMERVGKLLGDKKKLTTFSSKPSCNFSAKDVVIVDECDDVIFSNLSWFTKKLSKATVIGFTATPPTEEESHEAAVLASFFKDNIFDSKLSLQDIDG